jgi:phenylalanyl-tRNA synthetase alpha chain
MTDYEKELLKLTNSERKVLYNIKKNILEIANELNVSEQAIITTIRLLENKGITKTEFREKKYIVLGKFGEKFKNKLPEIKLLEQIKLESKYKKELDLDNEEFTAAIGPLKREKLIEIKKDDNGLLFSITENGLKFLKNNLDNPLKLFETKKEKDKLSDFEKEVLKSFENRKGFLKEIVEKEFVYSLTNYGESLYNYLIENPSLVELDLKENLTYDMLKSKNFENFRFRHYEIDVPTEIPLEIGREHPMLEANRIISDVFIEMGFKEMRGPLVESAFWNMDILWIPQDHPARDEQDTFYLDGKCDVPKELMEKVRNMHEVGIKRTHTLKGEWSEEITRKRLLRTHSTATTFRLLYELGKKLREGKNIDGKYFYVANNFRNEAIDATHLAEFFQAEGFIIGDNLSLADLMGFVKEFYSKFGLDEIKFKPTFNPYTEPSMEAHYYDKKLNKWYALINSGIFRPETLKPLGLENKTIIAWGIGASRVATLLTGAKSMRDITGHTCDFEWLRTRKVMTRKIGGRD